MQKHAEFSVVPEGKGFTVCREGKAMRTPRDVPLTVSTQALALAIAQEFDGQGTKMDLRKMPFTQMALTSIDISAPRREDVLGGIMRFGMNELVCQRATSPADLVAEQNEIWQPYLDWCKSTFNIDLRTGSGIVPFEQKPEALGTLREFVETLDAFCLTGLSESCNTLSSLVLGLALMTGRSDASTVFDAAELELLWQNKKWGDDPALQNRYMGIKRDLESCANWFALLK